ncbi:GerAB/ArcD/ProY family transporter [Metabacillus hrfriensis]|uniref:GerAB/ArcD/ProY family transporter n=1 Tax=Metabacillus hrfriensis TaxID=3048891 RepID=A0ACD4RHI7_9BACI|nr:GerAB/ArcD/ProY family transporter [Metabacillus sp. CT-WN-B3]USK30697.1 spore germination protein [Bacillus sp. CMF21]WHZ59947.1 GerAB/ArcD/ProY family transporter [Metabacillus sp. CT-WN-B3]
MSKIKIDGIQLFCIMVLFMFGTAVFLDLGSGAKQDAWIVTLISPFAGLILFTVYVQLHKRFPDLPLTEYVRKIWGKYIGGIIGYFYIIYFIYIASRVLRDFEELLISAPYNNTSIITIGICMTFVLIYSVNLGIEVFTRAACICFIMVAFTLFILNIFYVIGDLIHFENVKPILADGWKPILKELIPLNITVPYGELIILSMIFPYINKQTKLIKVGSMAVVFVGLYLTLNTLLLICILGTDVQSRSAFPALTAVSYINIAGFIQRLDTFVILLVVILAFIKVSIFFFCAVIGMNNLFKLKPSLFSTYFVGAIIYISSIIIAPSYQNHLDEGLKKVPYLLHIPFQIVIPALLLITVFIKGKIKQVPS